MPNSTARAVAVVFLVIGATAAIPAFTQDLPKRKPGLWQHNMTSIGAGMPPVSATMCTDERMDKMLADRPGSERCSQQTARRDGSTLIVESVCTQQNTTITTKGRFSGDFNSSFTGELHSTYEPPLQGMKESRQKIEARWLGPCKPGQKPGDVMVQGAGGMNMQEMMKGMDPKQMEEMMRQMEQMKGVKPPQ